MDGNRGSEPAVRTVETVVRALFKSGKTGKNGAMDGRVVGGVQK